MDVNRWLIVRASGEMRVTQRQPNLAWDEVAFRLRVTIPTMTDGIYPQVKVFVVCFRRKRHYRKDGSCKHTEALLAQMKPGYRQRYVPSPFGKAAAR